VELPAENLLAPEIVRRFCWQDPPAGGFALEEVSEFLQSRGARGWQIDLSAPLLHAIQGEVEPFRSESPDEADSSQELE
jgi:ribonuclease D